MGLLITFTHIIALQFLIYNSNIILALQYNIINDINDIDTHTFNLLSPIKQHLYDHNNVQLGDVVNEVDDKYHKIAKKLIGIEKLGEEIAQTDYLPEEIKNTETPNPNDDQKKRLSNLNDSIKDSSELLVSTNQSELEADESERAERDRLLNSTQELFENNSKEDRESHIPTLENELEVIESEKDETLDCIPDYTLPCPRDYVLYDRYCIATRSYTGTCSHKIKSMQDKDNEFKEAWSRECKSQWLCMPEKCENGTDYTKQCPITYIEDGIYCRSPIHVDTKYISFNNIDEKIRFERMNNVRWPCRVGYISNYANECPKGYIKSDIECKSVVDIFIDGCDIFKIPRVRGCKFRL